MSNGHESEKPCVYQVEVKGRLEAGWSIWFEGFSISSQANKETLFVGLIKDQSALHGLLGKIAGLGLPLLSVIRMEDSQGSHKKIQKEEGE